jgi:phosphonate transport system ATP-binding protein
VDLALAFDRRIVGLRHGRIVLDTPAAGLTRAAAMAVYGRAVDPIAGIG